GDHRLLPRGELVIATRADDVRAVPGLAADRGAANEQCRVGVGIETHPVASTADPRHVEHETAPPPPPGGDAIERSDEHRGPSPARFGQRRPARVSKLRDAPRTTLP